MYDNSLKTLGHTEDGKRESTRVTKHERIYSDPRAGKNGNVDDEGKDLTGNVVGL